MNIPAESDWGEIDKNDLDAKYAFKQFFGKSLKEAEIMFEKNALHYQEDLYSMPKKVFSYYILAFTNYLTSEVSAEDSDGASSFLQLVLWLLKNKRSIVNDEILKTLLNTAKRVAENQEFYDADIEIYGEFPDLFAKISGHANGA